MDQRQQAIQKAKVLREGRVVHQLDDDKWTLRTFEYYSAAKRYCRSLRGSNGINATLRKDDTRPGIEA